MPIEIKHKITGEVLKTVDAEDLIAADLGGANLSSADLRWANLRDADLSGANLRWANLRDADLRDANLRDADLRWANLRDADLGGADLGDADLSGANLGGADLRGADLRWANLGGADLGGANLMLFRLNRHQAIFTPCRTVTIGCDRHNLDHWLEHADEFCKRHNYSEIEIRAYKQWLEICREVQQSEGGEHS